jgi:hypothetical protein
MQDVADPVARQVPRRRGVPAAPLGLVAVLAIALVVAGVAVSRAGTGCLFAGDRCLRVLFIGNSYTSVNDLPATFARLAASAGRPVETGMIAPGGAFLADEAASADVAGAVAGTHWGVVVLQEQSERPASNEVDAAMIPAVITLTGEARAAGASVYLLATWAHRDGWPGARQDYATMQRAIDAAYARAASRSGTFVVAAGDAWQRARAEAPGIVLWQDDGSHPTPAGTYLAACVLLRSIAHVDPRGLADHEGLDDATATRLQDIAAEG